MTSEGRQASPFFVAGGTLGPDAPSYVKRPTDDELFNQTLAGEFCYVLTPRQMGKSSLMVRTARRLQERGVNTAIIDLTQIGTDIDAERWYLSFLSQLRRRLGLSTDPALWWQEHATLTYAQRLTDFLQDVILTEVEGQIAIFVDEIDSTLNLDFRDDFFAAVRAAHNARATEPAFERLIFVLLGVASPPELIKDPARTPFNIGHAIALQEFSRADAAVLRDGLEATYPGQGNAILNRIYYWTAGHPYLTQKLCLAAVESPDGHGSEEWVDGLVQELFLAEEARRETNLQFVQDKLLTHPQRTELLALYKKVVRGRRIRDSGQSPVQNQLKLAGLVKTADGYLTIRNRIYRRAFDLAWVRKNTTVNWAPIVAGAAVCVAFVALGLLAYSMWVNARFDEYRTSFSEARSPEEQLESLAKVFRLRPLAGRAEYVQEAKSWFYGLSQEEQLALIKAWGVDSTDLVVVVRGLYVTLGDVDGRDSTNPLLQAMEEAVLRFDATNRAANELSYELRSWLAGRRATQEGLALLSQDQRLQAHRAFQEAVTEYTDAILRNDSNPATLYERARALTNLGEHEKALDDLDRVVAIAKRMGQWNSAAASPEVFHTADPLTTPQQPSTSSFVTVGQIQSAVRSLITANPGPVDELAGSPASRYRNLWSAGLVSTPTPTPAGWLGPTPVVSMSVPGRMTLRNALAGLEKGVTAVAFSPDGYWLATGGEMGIVELWDLQTTPPPVEPRVLRGHSGAITSLAFSPDGGWLATGSGDNTAQLWDPQARDSSAERQVLSGHGSTVTSLAFSPDGRWLATGSYDETALLWDLQAQDPSAEPRRLRGHDNAVTSLAFSPDGRLLVTCSGDSRAQIWQTDNGRPLAVLAGHTDAVTGVAWSPDGGRIYTGGADGTLRVWDADSGTEIAQLPQKEALSLLKLSPDGQRVATAGLDVVRVWDVATEQELFKIEHTIPVGDVAFSSDGLSLATASGGTIWLWDMSQVELAGIPAITGPTPTAESDWKITALLALTLPELEASLVQCILPLSPLNCIADAGPVVGKDLRVDCSTGPLVSVTMGSSRAAYVYHANGVELWETSRELTELMENRLVPVTEALHMTREGGISDGSSSTGARLSSTASRRCLCYTFSA